MKILIVVDSVFWVTGTMAEQIRRRFQEFDILVCSYFSLKEILQENQGRFPEAVDLVHYFINAYSNENYPVFHGEAAIISTIHHVEDESDVFPLTYSDAVQTVCLEWHRFLEEKGAKSSDLCLIPNGIDCEMFRPARSRREALKLRAKYNIPKEAFVVGFSAKRSSNTSDRKGVDVLEELVTTNSAKRDGLWWVIRGPGWQDLVDRLQSEGAPVTYLPFMLPGRELAESYRLMDAYVVTSRIEGGPVPLMEAMATGLPVVSTRVGTALDVIEEGVNGFLAPFGDATYFMKTLSRLQAEPDRCREIGQCARRSIAEKYSWGKVLNGIPQLYSYAQAQFFERTSVGRNDQPFSKPFSKEMKRKIDLINLKYASQELQMVGSTKGGRYYATLGLLRSPLDLENLKRFLFWTYFGVPYFGITSTIAKFKRRLFG